MTGGYPRCPLPQLATRRQLNVLAAFVEAGGSVPWAAALLAIRPDTVKRHLAELRARLGLTTKQLTYSGRAWDG
jgi:DNA-binding NarL/FixJ family response regulator